jgi:hypothetical protein
MPSNDPEVPLSHAAKSAIRAYMLSMIAVPTIILTALSGLGGFVFAKSQEVVYQTALLDAKTKAVNELAEVQRSLSVITAESQAARTLMKRDQDDIQASVSTMKATFDSLQGAKDIATLIARLDETLGKSTPFQEAVARQVRPSIAVSEVTRSAGDCAAPNRKTLGAYPQVKFCSLSMAQTYRHGQNKGGLSCQVSFEQNQWFLSASGPTHECGSAGGATNTQCQAVCWQ